MIIPQAILLIYLQSRNDGTWRKFGDECATFYTSLFQCSTELRQKINAFFCKLYKAYKQNLKLSSIF